MPDFAWTRQHALIPSRTAVQIAFEQAGFQFAPATMALERERRPRSIGTTTDERARIELIGPEDVVFKATLMLHAEPDSYTSDAVLDDLSHFVQTIIPSWSDGPGWVRDQIATLATQKAQTRVGDVAIELQTTHNQQQILIRMTWAP